MFLLLVSEILVPETLVRLAQEELDRCPYTLGCKLKVVSSPGKIAIQGVAKSFYQKQMAGEAIIALIRKLDWKVVLRNEIEVFRKNCPEVLLK